MQRYTSPIPWFLSDLLLLARILSKLRSTNPETPQAAEWGTQAESEWRALLDLNSDCSDYYRAFLANRGIDLGRVSVLFEFCELTKRIRRQPYGRVLSKCPSSSCGILRSVSKSLCPPAVSTCHFSRSMSLLLVYPTLSVLYMQVMTSRIW